MTDDAAMKPMIVLLLAVCGVLAHPVSQVAVRVNILSNRVDVVMHVKAEDLVWFHNLTNQTEVIVEAQKLRSAAKLHRGFLLNHFRVFGSAAVPLPGEVTRYDDSVIATEGLSPAALKTADIRYQLSYELDSPEPWLTFEQDFGGDTATVPAMMELDVHHLGVRIGQPVTLPENAPRWVRLDWVNGPTIPPKNLAEIRQRKTEAVQKKLGLVDDLGVYSFIHIERTNIRLELLMPLWKWRTLSELHPLAVVHINGKRVAGSLDRRSFHSPAETDIGDDKHGFTNEKHARIALMMNYQTDVPLKEIRFEWRAFSKAIPFLKSMILVPGRNPTQTYFTNERRTFVWRAKTPLLELSEEDHWGHRHLAGRIIVHEIKSRGIIRSLQK
ncbi:MAG: hypothetical protein ACPGVU_03060 [Limisphaerales bacterium]